MMLKKRHELENGHYDTFELMRECRRQIERDTPIETHNTAELVMNACPEFFQPGGLDADNHLQVRDELVRECDRQLEQKRGRDCDKHRDGLCVK